MLFVYLDTAVRIDREVDNYKAFYLEMRVYLDTGDLTSALLENTWRNATS